MKNTPKPNEKFSGVELFRFIASFGIVWFHCKSPGSRFAYGALPFFMMVSVFFAFQNRKKQKSSVKIKFIRIIIPWIFWSLVYFTARLLLNLTTGSGLFNEFQFWMFFTGPSLHLWYLPYLFITLIILNTNIVYQLFLRMNDTVLLLFSVSILVITSFLTQKLIYIIPISQYIFLFPAIIIGLFWGRVLPITDHKMQYSSVLLYLIISVLISFFQSTNISIPYISAVILFFLALKNQNISIKYSLFLGELSFGIYLVHPLFISIILKLQPSMDLILLPVLTFITSIVFVITLKSTIFRKYI